MNNNINRRSEIKKIYILNTDKSISLEKNKSIHIQFKDGKLNYYNMSLKLI